MQPASWTSLVDTSKTQESVKEPTLLTKTDDIYSAAAGEIYAAPREFFVELGFTSRRNIWNGVFSQNAVLVTYAIFDCMRTAVNLYKTLQQPKGTNFSGTIIAQLLEDNWRYVVRK